MAVSNYNRKGFETTKRLILSFFQAEVDAEGLNSDFDLNSLIEGDVDDDDFGEEFVTALEEPKADKKDGPVRVHFEPLKVSLSWGRPWQELFGGGSSTHTQCRID